MVFIHPANTPDNLPVVPLYINGIAQPVGEHELFPVISSIRDVPIHYAVSATPASATAACDAAAAAFTSWRKTSPAHRRGLLLKAADILESRMQDIMQWQMDETSCPKEWAWFNIKNGVTGVREIAAATTEIRGTVSQRETSPDGSEGEGLTVVVREPIGVVLVIPP
jgi:acyl-CoA reductase-like NAD-dependent aldehyde dehydrogenase